MPKMANYSEQGASAGAEEDSYVLPVKDLLLVLWRRLWVIALVVLLLTALAVGASLLLPPTYEASVKILVGQEQGITDTPNDVAGLQQLTETMAQAVASRPVAATAIEQLDLKITPESFLEDKLDASPIGDTQFVEVTYTDSDPERAKEVANAVGEVFSERISEFSSGNNAVTATVWERAVTPENPSSPNPVRNGLLAMMLGLVLGIGLAFLLEYLDDSWRSPEEAEQISGVPTYGIIPAFKVPKVKEGKKEGQKKKGEK